jgi:hypothetical protein
MAIAAHSSAHFSVLSAIYKVNGSSSQGAEAVTLFLHTSKRLLIPSKETESGSTNEYMRLQGASHTMLLNFFALRISLLMLVLSAISVAAQQKALPDAPKPGDPVNNTPTAIEKRRWSDVVEPGEKVPPLSTADKLMFPLHEEIRLSGWFSAFFSSGWGQLVDSDPRYGVDSGAFSERFGAAALRDLSMRTFSDGVLPALLHEDPRYYREADGSLMHRGLYAASRVVVTSRDSGTSGFNTSVVLGHGMASALTLTYYPDKSANGTAVMKTWGYSLLGQAGGNLWSEFWPDIRNKIFRRHNK